MSDSLKRRVDNLGAREASSATCGECGGEPPKDAPVEIIWEHEETLEQSLAPRECHACGRTLIHDIYWDDDPQHPMNRG